MNDKAREENTEVTWRESKDEPGRKIDVEIWNSPCRPDSLMFG